MIYKVPNLSYQQNLKSLKLSTITPNNVADDKDPKIARYKYFAIFGSLYGNMATINMLVHRNSCGTFALIASNLEN